MALRYRFDRGPQGGSEPSMLRWLTMIADHLSGNAEQAIRCENDKAILSTIARNKVFCAGAGVNRLSRPADLPPFMPWPGIVG